ncbi:MAG: DUF362 domain-containing protein [Deltaproteobacteria bacterium]|nr:DUF362 domain-containing protein [Deltaproteobacteria bacterium]
MKTGKDFDSFATLLVQILEKVHPAVSIVDGVLGMEGDGPNNGTPRHIGIIGASSDAVALDAERCRLVGIPVERVRTCVIGQNLGVGRAHADDIELGGDQLPGFPLTDFRLPKSVTVTWNLSAGNPIRKFMENLVATRPFIDPAECRNCGICMEHCPSGAIAEKNGVMVIDRRKCISCFCCHELCTNNAVRIAQPFLVMCLGKLGR